ncbi:MAG: signal peptidase I [Methanobrevibacter sp.]|uniref:signal peptidase I n=1 Tax=Methanobrevibacter sp. TaxID=66852 RepID=UPI0025F819CE|nr:signal peptidase I [Methanobrevibacter sp.]MBR0272045.1 signal peptidase I [Methanobrevibacter sp.]
MVDYKEIASYVIILVLVLILAQHLNVVVSGSMEPVFYRGDIVAIEKADFFGLHEFNASEVEVGDIVVYNAEWFEQPVIHRIIRIAEINGTTMYVIKGDNNNRTDPYYVTADQIESRVLTWGDTPIVIPYIGNLSLWLRGL